VRTVRSRLAVACAALVAAIALAGCGRPFAIQTPPGMIELEHQTNYAYRAMTPDGVVLAVRVVDDGKAGLAFWTQAVSLRMKEVTGYAALAATDVTSGEGTPGKELRFGHDEQSKPYVYVVRLFVQGKRLYIVEAGGRKEEMDRDRAMVDAAMGSIQLK
jgi:hypothetical protein